MASSSRVKGVSDDSTLTSYDYVGADCDLGSDGEEVVMLPDPAPGGFVWFVVVGQINTVEGGHGYDSSGVQRPLTGVGWCGVFSSQPTRLCP